jgi:Protein of unknown function (DUF2393)
MADTNQTEIFSEPKEPRSFPAAPLAIAAVAVVILVAVIVLMSRNHSTVNDPTKLQPLAAYAPSLVISGVEMSEAEIPSGGKQTYIDGHIANHGTATVTGITVQALFPNDQKTQPQMEMVSLNIVRSREPFVDLVPVNAAPLAPGGEADFRLIFEGITSNWNLKPPDLHVVQVGTK